jgi:hypothetical protein
MFYITHYLYPLIAVVVYFVLAGYLAHLGERFALKVEDNKKCKEYKD